MGKRKKTFWFWVVAFGIMVLVLKIAIQNDQAVKVIVGEAANQTFWGKVAVGEVIRNRGGIQGFSSRQKDLHQFYRDQPSGTRFQAQIAWMLSSVTNITHDSDHFDNVKAFGVPEWAANMTKTVQIDDMQYYRAK